MIQGQSPTKDHKKRVAIYSGVTIAAFITYLLVFPETSTSKLSSIKTSIFDNFSWFYMSSVAVFIVTLIYCGASKVGDLRLGEDTDRPDFSFFSWASMLFCTGMGIGLVFFGVAEPVMHYLAPPVIDGGTDEALRNAMNITFFHWGVNAWAIYAIVALVISYSAYRKGLPVEMRSALYPLLGSRIHGIAGDIVDTFAVLATVVGIVTPLGFGVMQINSGLNYLFGVPEGVTIQVVLIVAISLVTTASLLLGLKKGIKRLSLINMTIALALMLYVFCFGSTAYLLDSTVENIGNYLTSVTSLTFDTYAFTNPEWFQSWTLFYWAWWIAFAAPTGIFIARISKGRTIRQFVCGVLLIPVAFSFIWLSVFGNSALDLIHHQGMVQLGDAVMENSSTALFKFFDIFSGWSVISFLGLFCIFVFFITTADSGTMVINILTSSYEDRAPAHQRVFWVLVEAAITALLLLSGGMSAIQTTLIILGFPFALLIFFMCIGFIRDVTSERKTTKRTQARYFDSQARLEEKPENMEDELAATQYKS